jgi:hypothetical protein
MSLELLRRKVGLKQFGQPEKSSKPEELTAKTIDEFVQFVKSANINVVNGRVKNKFCPNPSPFNTRPSNTTGDYIYYGMLTAANEKKVITYSEDCAVAHCVYSGGPSRDEKHRMAVESHVTVQHRLRFVKSQIWEVEVNLLVDSNGRPFTQSDQITLDNDRRALGVVPLLLPSK